GVENPTQNINIFTKQQLSAFKMKKYENLHYQGTYELDFLTKYYTIDLKNGTTIRYNFENKNSVYYPDFYYEPLNLIVEIKSSYTYEKDLSKNLAKQKACLEQGYDFIFIINKDYSEFDKKLKVD
ncbi:hypothetical protein M0Q97_09200, partial [Candidatus Dojkabacteria bacterium]|nr:hypothetical protein [Candidatus Dojkabacteria bacterium]